MIFIKIVKHLFHLIIRNIYWLYNLSKLSDLRSITLHFPIIVEGRGKINLGAFSTIEKKASIKVALNSILHFEEMTFIGQFADIRVGTQASLIGKKKCSVGNNSRLFINNHWEFGNNSNIATNCSIFSRESGLFGRLIMRDNSYIADNCIIDVADDIIIGEDVAIGPNCTFYTHDHEYNDLNIPAWKGEKKVGKILIGDKSWIGSNVIILPNVTIGQHVIVAAGSVVTKSIPDNTIWAGVPAKQIKSLENQNNASN